MNIRQDRRSYYIFLLLTLSSSVLTLLIGISMAWLNLQNTIESRTRDFDKLLVMLDSLYLTPLGHSNQTALQLIEEQMDKPAIAGGAPALNAVWKAPTDCGPSRLICSFLIWPASGWIPTPVGCRLPAMIRASALGIGHWRWLGRIIS